VATVEVVVETDPQIVDGSVVGVRRMQPRVVFLGTLRQVSWWQTYGLSESSTGLPITVWAPIESAQLLPGTVIGGRSLVQAGDPSRGTALTLVLRQVPVVVSQPPWWQQQAGNLREGLRNAVVGLPADGAALLPGLVLGDTSTMSEDLATDLRSAGLSHLTAVSGTNVTAVLAAVIALAGLCRCGPRTTTVLAIIALIGFVILVRPSPSVVRAAVMGAIGLVALARGGKRRGPPILASSVIVLVLLDPWLSVSAGFALSVAATAGLLLLSPRIASRLHRLPTRIGQALAVTISAQITTAPVLVLIGATVGLGSIPANVAAEVMVTPATLFGVAATLVAPMSQSLAHVVAWPGVLAASWIALVARVVAAQLALPLPWPVGPAGAVLASLAICLGLAAARYRRSLMRLAHLLLGTRAGRAAIASVSAVSVVSSVAIPHAVRAATGWPPAGWNVVFCDVGQGDGAVVRVGEGSAVVVDAGPDPNAIDRCLTDLGISQVPFVMLTHFHADHVEGLPGVLRGRSVGEVLVSPLPEPADEAERVQQWCDHAHVPERVVTAGDHRRVGDVDSTLIWPSRIIRGQGSDPNNSSLTAVLTVAGVRVLFGGDLETAAQDAVIDSVGSAGVDVIKVPHHGSRKQSARWVTWPSARVAVISVGADNDYGHPAPQTLAAYRAHEIAVWRTDQSADIAVLGTGSTISVVGRASKP